MDGPGSPEAFFLALIVGKTSRLPAVYTAMALCTGEPPRQNHRRIFS
jgi:hypothetical protein